MRKRYVLKSILLFGLFTSFLQSVHANENAPKVNYNNKQVEVKTFVDNHGVLYVQARNYLESIGYEVSWSEEERKVMSKSGQKQIEVKIDSKVAYVNGFELEKPVIMVNDTLYIPIIELTYSLGHRVNFEKSDNIQIINSKDPFREFDWETNENEIKLKSKDLKELTDLGYVIAYDNYTLFGFSSQVYYHFKDRKLKEIAYRIKDKEHSFERFSKIRYELEQTYGKPEYDQPNFISEESLKMFTESTKDKTDEDVNEIFYNMINNGEVSIVASWKAEGHTVDLMLSGSGASKKDQTFIDISIRQNGFVFTGS